MPVTASRTWTAEQAAVARRVNGLRQATYYDILGVRAQAGITEIRRAFQSLALQLHPDKNSAPGAEEAFKLIAEAWEVLRDTSSRAAYDAAGFDSYPLAGSSGFASQSGSNWTPPAAPSSPPPPQSRKKRRNRRYKEKLDRQRAEQVQEAARAARREEWQARSAQDVLNRLAQMGARLVHCSRCNAIHVLFEGDRLEEIHPGASFQTFAARQPPSRDESFLYSTSWTDLCIIGIGFSLGAVVVYLVLRYVS